MRLYNNNIQSVLPILCHRPSPTFRATAILFPPLGMSRSVPSSGVMMILWIDSLENGYVEYALQLPSPPFALQSTGASVDGFIPRAHFDAIMCQNHTLMATVALKAVAIDRCYPYLFKRRLVGAASAPLRELYFEGITVRFNEHCVPVGVMVTERHEEIAAGAARFFQAVRQQRFSELGDIFVK